MDRGDVRSDVRSDVHGMFPLGHLEPFTPVVPFGMARLARIKRGGTMGECNNNKIRVNYAH